MICSCGGNLVTTHTKNLPLSTIKRRRECRECGCTLTTYERPSGDALDRREQRLLDTYRVFTKEMKASLWTHIRALKQMVNKG